jgi:PleD family two-component response regulator
MLLFRTSADERLYYTMMTAKLNLRDLDRSVTVEIFPIDNSAFSKEDACTRHKTPSTSKAAKLSPLSTWRCVCMQQVIFVVEGKLDVCQLVGHCLERAGYAVRKFTTAAQVISQAEEVCPALIIISLSLPNGIGLELCCAIRRRLSLARTPIVFLAGTGPEVDDCIIGLESGGNDYIPVPFNPREMVARVQAVLRRFDRLRTAPQPASVVKIGILKLTERL